MGRPALQTEHWPQQVPWDRTAWGEDAWGGHSREQTPPRPLLSLCSAPCQQNRSGHYPPAAPTSAQGIGWVEDWLTLVYKLGQVSHAAYKNFSAI